MIHQDEDIELVLKPSIPVFILGASTAAYFAYLSYDAILQVSDMLFDEILAALVKVCLSIDKIGKEKSEYSSDGEEDSSDDEKEDIIPKSSKSYFVDKYSGWSVEKTEQYMRDSLGKAFFIDEANCKWPVSDNLSDNSSNEEDTSVDSSDEEKEEIVPGEKSSSDEEKEPKINEMSLYNSDSFEEFMEKQENEICEIRKDIENAGITYDFNNDNDKYKEKAVKKRWFSYLG